MKSLRPAELGAYVEYNWAIVKAKLKAGYTYPAQSIFDMSESQRMEWITYRSMQPRRREKICFLNHDAPSPDACAQAFMQGTVMQIQRHLRTLVAAPKQSDVTSP